MYKICNGNTKQGQEIRSNTSHMLPWSTAHLQPLSWALLIIEVFNDSIAVVFRFAYIFHLFLNSVNPMFKQSWCTYDVIAFQRKTRALSLLRVCRRTFPQSGSWFSTMWLAKGPALSYVQSLPRVCRYHLLAKECGVICYFSFSPKKACPLSKYQNVYLVFIAHVRIRQRTCQQLVKHNSVSVYIRVEWIRIGVLHSDYLGRL